MATLSDLTGINLLIMAVLDKEGPTYGLRMIASVEEMADGEIKLATGHLYTALNRMHDQGLIELKSEEAQEGRGGRTKKIYDLTSEGRQTLERAKSVLRKTLFIKEDEH